MSGDGHDYEGKYGTQEQQAARQASIGTGGSDGPWRLGRILQGQLVILPNSVRSTLREINRLADDERVCTGIEWGIFKYAERNERNEK